MRLEMSNQNDYLYSYTNGYLNLDGIRNLCSANVNMGRVLEQRYEKKKRKTEKCTVCESGLRIIMQWLMVYLVNRLMSKYQTIVLTP